MPCTTDAECLAPANGKCTNGFCDCKKPWMNQDGKGCAYQGRSKLVTFLLSFFLGIFGADWFYLSYG